MTELRRARRSIKPPADEEEEEGAITEKSPLRGGSDVETDRPQRSRRRRQPNISEAAEELELGPLPPAPEAAETAEEVTADDAKSPPAGGRRRRRGSSATASDEEEEDSVAGDDAAPADAVQTSKRANLMARMRRKKGGGAAGAAASVAEVSDAEADDAAGQSSAAPPPPPPQTLDVTERPAPTFVPLSKRLKAEAAIYTTARLRTTFPLAGRRSRTAAQPPDDGLYVAPKPAASTRALAALETRLGFAPASKALSDEAGALLRQPDPVRHVRVRPSWLDVVNLASEQRFELERRRPQSWGRSADDPLSGGGAPHVLQVSLGGMKLHDHPLFLHEHALQRSLRSLAAQLADAHARQATQLFALKISELSSTTASLREQMAAREGGGGSASAPDAQRLRARLSALTIELLETRQLKDEQECAERLLARRTLRLWRSLKREREAQGFKATRARMQFQLLEPASEEEAAALETELEDEIEERRLIHALSAVGAEEQGSAAAAANEEVTLHVEYIFTYSCDAATRIWITYSAWLTLYMTGTRTYSTLMYSQNRLNMNRIPYFLFGSAYSTYREVTAIDGVEYMYICIYVYRYLPLPSQLLEKDLVLEEVTAIDGV